MRRGRDKANSLLELPARKASVMPKEWGCGEEQSHFSTPYPGKRLPSAGPPQVGLLEVGFYELLHNQESLSERFSHLTHTLPAI